MTYKNNITINLDTGIYIAMKSTYLRSVKYERSNFYILNRFDIITVQELPPMSRLKKKSPPPLPRADSF